jgi:hypothetical protein
MKLDGLEKVDYGLIRIKAMDKDFGYDIFKVTKTDACNHKYEVVLTEIDCRKGMSLQNVFEEVMEAVFEQKLKRAMPSDILWFLNEIRPTSTYQKTYPVRKGKFNGHKFVFNGIKDKDIHLIPDDFRDYNREVLFDKEMRKVYGKVFLDGSLVEYAGDDKVHYKSEKHDEEFEAAYLFDLEVLSSEGSKVLVKGNYSLAPKIVKSDVFEMEADKLLLRYF